jgi:hypothetical protein
VPELRVETVVPVELASDMVAALVAGHPYEEVAFDPLLACVRSHQFAFLALSG